jgi:hypothetical protein
MRGLATDLPHPRLRTQDALVYALCMTVQAEHHDPIGKTDSLDTWRKRMRMPVPTADGTIADLWIVRMYETTTVNALS